MGKVIFAVTAWWCLTCVRSCHRKIYDTLAEPAQFESLTSVPAIAMNITCGEVPLSNWTVGVTTVPNGINLTVSATLNQRALGQYTTGFLNSLSPYYRCHIVISGVFTAEDTSQAPQHAGTSDSYTACSLF